MRHAYLVGPKGLIDDGALLEVQFTDYRALFRVAGVCLPTAERPAGQVRLIDEPRRQTQTWIVDAAEIGLRVVEAISTGGQTFTPACGRLRVASRRQS